MKKRSNYVFYGMFAITMSIILIELYGVVKYHHALSQGKLGLPPDSASAQMAGEMTSDFIASQIAAAHTRYRTVVADLLKHLLYILIACLFLVRPVQNHALKLAEKRITVMQGDFRDLKRVEANYISIAVGLYLFSILLISIVKSKDLDWLKIVEFSCLFVSLNYFVVPFIIFVTYVALRKFHKKFIVCCYIAYIAKVLPELLIQDEADTEKMVKMKINEFPREIQEVLTKYDLQDRVYKEIEPGKDINAALIGYGEGKRMEIYGDLDGFSKQQIYAILLHEVGHVEEHSLVRKSSLYFALLLGEMCILLWAYDYLTPKYSSSKVSYFTSFVFIFIIYRLLLRQWIFVSHRFVSQNSENNSDMFAKRYSFQNPLANALFDIGVDSKDYLRPTYLYNGLRSTHPSIYSRVEGLKK